jgi:hypothetical protein|tara:strand:- start:617 stop:820 length:204 start_codon:yes stop_codon:yes gene_type:complete
MECYRCEDCNLVLAPLWPAERENYAIAGLVLRQCLNCGLEQNHVGDGEPLEPANAAQLAPPHKKFDV